MNDTLYVQATDFGKGFAMVENTTLYDKTISNDLFRALVVVSSHFRMYPDKPMTQKLFSRITGMSRYITSKLFKEAERLGYVTHTVILPHKQTDTESVYYTNHWIQHAYTWYASPKLNTNFKEGKEKKKMICGVKDFVKQYNKAEPKIDKEIENITKENSNKEENEYYSIISERFKSSIFMNIMAKDLNRVPMSEEMVEFMKTQPGDMCSDNRSLEELSEICWNMIVRASSSSEKSYKNFRYSDLGKEVANSMQNLMINRFNKLNIYNKETTHLKGIKELQLKNTKLNKLLLLRFSQVIANYIDLGFLLNDKKKKKVPRYEELVLLFETLEEHPEFICLDYSQEHYLLFSRFFKAKLKASNL